MEIAGNIFLITGAGSGMGAETAHYLSQKGAKIAVVDKDFPTANNIASQVGGLPIKCDVTDAGEAEAALKTIMQEWGEIRGCINCAGIAPAKRIIGKNAPLPLEEFTHTIRVNLIGTFNLLRLCAFYMSTLAPIGEDAERGIIINTASVAAFEGQIGQAAYSASKGGVCAMTLPAARELAQFNIRVMTIAPGMIETPLLETLPEEVKKRLGDQIPFPSRFGKPTEYAMLVGQIIENPYLNGEVIRLDGALRMQAK